MPRLSIDISSEDHQRLKALAALRGQSLKEFVLTAALGHSPDVSDMSEDQALDALKAALEPRLREAVEEGGIGRTVSDIAAEARTKHNG